MKNNINTIYDLADYINSQYDYPSDVEEIIDANKWERMEREDIVCRDGDTILYINDYGFAVTR